MYAAKPLQLSRYSYTAPVTTAAYTTFVTSPAWQCSELEIFDSSGSLLYLAYGTAGNEQNLIYIFPGGNGRIQCMVPASTRLALKAVDVSATAGQLAVIFYAK